MLARLVQNLYGNKAFLYGLIAVDFLFVALFAFAYSHLLPWWQNEPALRFSIARDGAMFDGPVSGFFHCLYFSIVTQMTVGFGDIIPASESARFVVSLQATFGYFYLAILVSVLVGRVFRSKKASSVLEFPQYN